MSVGNLSGVGRKKVETSSCRSIQHLPLSYSTRPRIHEFEQGEQESTEKFPKRGDASSMQEDGDHEQMGCSAVDAISNGQCRIRCRPVTIRMGRYLIRSQPMTDRGA